MGEETASAGPSSCVNSRNHNLVCGVVEGFYGRPWTTEQRKDLFQRMKKLGLNTYMYAPKDDVKHRAYWRELYTVEEAEHLTNLIQAARENSVNFYYALSPGLDITYSSSKEVSCLKRKLEQVAQFGCGAFALLFDDIEPEISETDKEVFQSFAHAQVSVTNEVYQELNQPKFIFCPTEYCAARAVPNVQNSEYLNTIGLKLMPGIDIMWTGNKVISKTITVQSIQELTEVLRRPPVIWDNLHANDYDQKRLFLGPYSGRSTDLVPHLRGVLSNPNCEYEANFVPVHTLAQWSKCSSDGKTDLNESVSADIRLETEGESEELTSHLEPHAYHPRKALRAALVDWLPEFYRTKSAYGRLLSGAFLAGGGTPTPPSGNASTSASVASSSHIDEAPSFQPLSSELVNSLVQPSSTPLEPMDCLSSSEAMQTEEPLDDARQLTLEDLAILVDLFYLPFEHGIQGVAFLHEFHWLRVNGHVVWERCKQGNVDSEAGLAELEEWRKRASKFDQMTQAVGRLFARLTFVPNRALLYDLYPYLWDIKGVISLLNSYVKWIALGDVPCSSPLGFASPSFSWFSKGYKEAFISGEQEPWLFRGGLTAELQRLLPLESVSDLFLYKPPESPSSKTYTIRPYLPSDEPLVYEVCRKTCDDGMDGTEVFPEFPNLIGDKLVGGFLTLSNEYCFVVEDETGVCGYALAALDAQQFSKKLEAAWTPELCVKYPAPIKESSEMLTPAEEIMNSFHSRAVKVPDIVYKHHPSRVTISMLPSIIDSSVSKRLLACVLAALKANGSHGVFSQVTMGDKNVVEFYTKLGFLEIALPDFLHDDTFFLGRTF
ncbi:protein O-GlcNAcase isoform X2 [Rhipicephalus sanguineus]|uniref:protein O-GlcNAcase isoform X2 n=1 Tax=Rhipicephalus sanguineus TaxID=34632 RepID=UPI00189461A3|nr:protein O-GlcNAcase isoform X2 [Rhipicephalus sanguineus]